MPQPRPVQPPLLLSGIRDNHTRGSVGDFLKTHILPGASLSIVSAYFTIAAFDALKESLRPIERLRFLYGEPRGITAIDSAHHDGKAFAIVESGLQLATVLRQKRLARECADWIRDRVDIRSITRAGFLHGKMYHIAHQGTEAAILGSSNFTVPGLGLGTSRNNIELNLEVDSTRDRRDLLAWFDALWNDPSLVTDVKDEVLTALALLYRNQSPQFIYYKTLFHLFGHYLDQQEQSNLLTEQHQLVDTAIWQALFAFQRDGVRAALAKLRTHNGCILADSVGLGKTYEALAVIKYFEQRNARVLVLCPKKLRENWTVYQAQNNSPLNPFLRDRFSYTVLSHTDLSRTSGRSGDVDLASIHWGNYDLVVIDESHTFRNATAGTRTADGTTIRKSRYERLMDDIIRSGVPTSVLLLSATPVNTDLSDLRNQLAFITEGRDDAFQSSLGIGSLRDTLAAAQRTFSAWAQEDGPRDSRELLNRLSAAFFTLLDELTIARSRRHIQASYQETVQQLGGFPERQKPVSVVVDDLDLHGRFLSYDRLHQEISDYRLALFNPTAYVLDAYTDRYDQSLVRNFRQSTREHFLIGMMRVNFLKRLESSIHAFTITLDRTIRKIEALEQRLTRFHQQQSPSATLDVDVEGILVDDDDDDDTQAVLQMGTRTFQLTHLDTVRWLQDVQHDKEQLSLVHASAEQVTAQRDAKLARLKDLIVQKVRHPTTMHDGTPNRKVLVFTAFADTAAYLYQHLHTWAHHDLGIHCAVVTGTDTNRTTLGSSDYTHILTNFAPRAKHRAQLPSFPQDDEIDLLIATDCISEGQNVQDCDTVVNYDIHWNPVRIIQRFGRIDRIGSPNTHIHLINFWPTPDLNQYLNLRNRVEARMALVDLTATGDDNLLAAPLDDDLVKREMSYRDRQLLRLKEEILDLEDLNETITLTAFTLDEFRMELLTYLQQNRAQLAAAPLGLYAVVPPHPDYPLIAPGVVFCLRQRDTAMGSTINPLHPFCLVYVRDSGVVRLGVGQPRHILDLFRATCAEHTAPYADLCRLFDQRTQDGTEMTHEHRLLESAVQSITRTFTKRMATHLLSGRGASLRAAPEQVDEGTDVDLVTWLVILAPDGGTR